MQNLIMVTYVKYLKSIGQGIQHMQNLIMVTYVKYLKSVIIEFISKTFTVHAV